MGKPRFPRFLDISDRQLEEALKVLEKQFMEIMEPIFAENAILNPEEIFWTKHFESMAFSYMRKNLPEMLGFVQKPKS